MADHRVLFLGLTDDVGSDRIVSDLGRAGAACAVLSPPRAFASLPRCVEARFALPSRFGQFTRTLVVRARLSAAVRDWAPTAIVPLDELAALVLRTIAAEDGTRGTVRDLLVRSLGRVEGYAAACHRVPLMETAARLGIATPAFFSVPDTSGTSQAIGFPVVVKRDHSSGSGGVAAAENEAALARALRAARLKQRMKRGLARLAGFDHADGAILVQRFVPGRLAMHTVVARDGHVVDGQSLLAIRFHPQKRSSTVLQPIDSAGMVEAARRIVGALGCSGFVSFDFMLDTDGRPWLIEMNPRPIGSMHLGRLFGHDLAAAFLAGTASACTAQAGIEAVALFPKELERDPDANPGAAVHHDVPWSESAVLNAYVEHLARLHPGHAQILRQRFGQAGRVPPGSGSPAAAELSQA